jgi:hypothetical protein
MHFIFKNLRNRLISSTVKILILSFVPNLAICQDEPSTAFTADPLTGCISVSVDPSLYTPSNPPGAAGCAGNFATNPRPDIWVLLNVPASGTLFLNPQGSVDAGMAAYTFDAFTNTYTQIDCDDDTGPGLMPEFTVTLPPGTPIYIQLWAYGGGLINFSFCSSDCTTPLAYYPDNDGDGVGSNATVYSCTPDPNWLTTNGDCDDTNPQINNTLLENCGDGLDNNCEGQVDEGCAVDSDLDGVVDASDCAPNDPTIYPGAVEICNLADEDCDGVNDNGVPTTTYYEDVDGDGWGNAVSANFCFNPADPAPFCNYTFNLTDTFGDGWNTGTIQITTNGGASVAATLGNTFTTGTSISETVQLSNNVQYDLFWNLGGFYSEEIGLDVVDPTGTLIYSLPPLSSGLVGTVLTTFSTSCPPTGSYALITGDCDDANAGVNPGLNNCNLDTDGDGFDVTTDCNDNDPSINPSAIEICDYIDNDCDVEIDEFAQLAFFADMDNDGFGDINNSVFDCFAPVGYVADDTDCDDMMISYQDLDNDGYGGAMDACGIDVGGDCNDLEALAYPGAAEVCADLIDNNCDGSIDEGCGIADADGDGFDVTLDCNDNCATIFPGAICDDNNASTTGETIQVDCTCGGGVTITNCLGSESIVFSPAPVAGSWPVGTTVEVCYTLNYTQASGDWLDGMAVTLGTGWGIPTGTIAPANCGGGAPLWIWQTSNAPTATSGVPSGYGWYYDTNSDGNGGNDWGDAGSCTFSMCFSATTVASTDLWVAVASGGDSYYGSYSSTAGCPLVPFTVDPVNVPSGCELSFPYCATPSACDALTNVYALTPANSNLIQMYNAPTTGTLDVTLDGLPVQSFTAPFAGSAALNIVNLDSDGAIHTLVATFSDAPGCSASITYVAPAACSDGDGDGFGFSADCNDADPSIYPGAPEVCGNSIDDNCDNVVDEGCGTDVDGDGYDTTVDCNDNDNSISPGAAEACGDGIDNNCSGCVDEGCGSGGDEPCNAFAADPLTGCIAVTVDPSLFTPSNPPGAAGCAGNFAANPRPDVWVLLNVPTSGTLFLNPQGSVDAGMAAYTYDNLSNTYTQVGCDDDTGPGLMPQLTVTQPAGTPIYIQLWAYGGGLIDFSFCSSDCTTPTAYYTDVDLDGYGNNSAIYTCTPDPSWITTGGDCDDNDATINPLANEVCNDIIDNNCDGQVDEGCATDVDGDGYVTAEDCDDNNALVNAGATEICDGIDNNCDGAIDEGFNVVNYYFDGDFDGYGDPDVLLVLCDAPFGFVTDNTDCNDVLATINPGVAEDCTDALDNDCNGTINDGCGNIDNDGDGFDIIIDCNDNCAAIYPGATCDDGDPSSVGETIQADCSCGGGTFVTSCLGAQNISFDPLPTNGTWAVGTNVNICYTLQYAQASGDWLDGMVVTLGSGWGIPTGTLAPTTCSAFATGTWIWQDSNTPTSTNGIPTGGGYYFDYNNNGNGGDDFGDPGSCTFDMCFSATVVADVDLTVGVTSGGDSYFGSYNSTAGCPLEVYSVDPSTIQTVCEITFPYCITPSLCNVTNNNYSLTSANSNFVSLVNAPASGSLEISLDGVVVQTINAPFNSSYALNITGLASDGLSHTLSAAFTATTCSATYDYVAPATCAIIDNDGDTYANTEDCNDANASIFPGATEICDDLDNNCDGTIDDGLTFTTYYLDADGDGVGMDPVDLCYDPANPLYCNYTFNLSDDFGDGWNGGSLDIQDGITLVSIQNIGASFAVGSNAVETALLTNGASYNLFWTNGGFYAGEMGLDLLDPSGNVLYNLPYFSNVLVGTTLYSWTVACPAETMYVTLSGDCDDANNAVYPGATESCDLLDNNCDSNVDEGFDQDADGYSSCGGDCDDTQASINPGMAEICLDNLDNNCNGTIDEATGSIWYQDADGDGFGNIFFSQASCDQPVGYVLNFDDCNDNDASLTTISTEVCDGLDNDCDGAVDNGFTYQDYFADMDGDGFGDQATLTNACAQPVGYVTDNTDCNDTDALINTAAVEICDAQDNNCDGMSDEGFDLDADGYTTCSGDCNDSDASVNPTSTEICGNGSDEDCDGVDSLCGTLGCTSPLACNFDPAATIDDGSCILPTVEECDGLDNDCDGLTDDGVLTTYYADVDGDGLGNPNNTIAACSLLPGFVVNFQDCDDTDATLLGPGSSCDNGSDLDTLDTYQVDCSCQGLLFGCTDLVACNYDENATYEDGSCTYSNLQLASITGDSLVLPFTQAHQYSYPDTIPGLSFQWTLNALGVFIPNSSIDTSSVVTVFWSNATATIPTGVITLVVTDENCGPNASFTLTYIVNFDTTNYSVNEWSQGTLNVWPNPSRGEISLEVPQDIENDYEIQVVDLLGQVVYLERAQQRSLWRGNLNLSSGVYVVKLVGDNKLYAVPLIIEN